MLPVSDRFNEYAASVARAACARQQARVELDERSESVARKIRDAELRKIPFMLVVGEREQSEGSVSVREHHGEELGGMPVEAFLERLAGGYTAPH